MSASGKWEIAIVSPMGPQTGSFDFVIDGQVVTGSSVVMIFPPLPIANGVVTGDTLSFDVNIVDPEPMSVHFVLTTNGDEISGVAILPELPPFEVTGHRA